MGVINVSRVSGTSSVPTPPAGVDALFNDNGTWYFKNSAGVVSTIATGIITATGPAGTSGTSGQSGTDGTSGINGVNGSSGTSGLNGVNGANGSSGTSGVNGVNGSSGTSGLNGVNGANGSSGTSGVNGVNGSSGTSGVNGVNGSSGTSGVNGVSGSSGTSGLDGVNGANGSSGTSGVNGVSGSSGTSGVSGSGSFGITIDGGGSAITTGVKGYVKIPYSGTITSWTIFADVSGSCVIDVWKDTYANYPPTVVDTITGSEKPTLSSAIKNQDNALSTWTTSVTAGDIIGFNVDSASTVTRVHLSIDITKS